MDGKRRLSPEGGGVAAGAGRDLRPVGGLISEAALRVLSPTQLQAMVAHEIGHEYVWDAFEEARKKGDHARLQELELVCDGVAVLTLHRIGAPPSALIEGLRDDSFRPVEWT